MKFKNTEIKIDQLVNYLQEDKINLSPVFQRGHVWKVSQRRGLIKNMLLGRPIPAIFLYKKSEGSKYLYNILDGKQRIESIILFINDKRRDLSIPNWTNYLYGPIRKEANFSIQNDTSKKYLSFENLTDNLVRDFREYTIPTVEITLDNETELDEVINLFVDINQQGEPVKRFDIVKAICRESKNLKVAFDLIAIKQKRKNDIHYKIKDSSFSLVLKQLSIIQSTSDQKNKVDKIWQKLIEILLFTSTNDHVKPSEILKAFISKKDKLLKVDFTPTVIKKAQKVFDFFWVLFKNSQILGSPLALDQTHSYTAITSVIKHDLISKYGASSLQNKIEDFVSLITKRTSNKKVARTVKEYLDLTKSHTTDTSNRTDRELKFIDIIDKL